MEFIKFIPPNQGQIQGGAGGHSPPPPEISRHSEENKNVLCILMFLILFLEFFVPIFRIASQLLKGKTP